MLAKIVTGALELALLPATATLSVAVQLLAPSLEALDLPAGMRAELMELQLERTAEAFRTTA